MHHLVAATIVGAILTLGSARGSAQAPTGNTTTPIQHLVVIFQENESFDRYFGTYPVAANPPGEPRFSALPGTPAVNGLSPALITNNPNRDPPFRVGRQQSLSCFENGRYDEEQVAYDQGQLDLFVEIFKYTSGQLAHTTRAFCPVDSDGFQYPTMGHVDGNTVTALWNYAQHFAMSDNFFGSTYGPSTIGALNLVAGTTGSAICAPPSGVYGPVPVCVPSGGLPFQSTSQPPPTNGKLATLYTDQDPLWDVCSRSDGRLVAMAGPNVGDLLNAAGASWGWFEGGFTLDAQGGCSSAHPPVAYDLATGVDPVSDPYTKLDYTPHHEPFQYYASTANPLHLPPTSVGMIGRTDQANHQYDLSAFWQALEAGNLPAVSFLKAAAYQDSHAGYSNPLDEQEFLTSTLNRLQQSPLWSNTAVVITYDDSNGYYDHVMPPIVNRSSTVLDDACGTSSDGPPARCGYGPRLPFLLISPFARQNYASHVRLDQTSIVRFVEDNWLGGRRLGGSTFDLLAGPLADLFDFTGPPAPTVLLDAVSGQPMPTSKQMTGTQLVVGTTGSAAEQTPVATSYCAPAVNAPPPGVPCIPVAPTIRESLAFCTTAYGLISAQEGCIASVLGNVGGFISAFGNGIKPVVPPKPPKPPPGRYCSDAAGTMYWVPVGAPIPDRFTC